MRPAPLAFVSLLATSPLASSTVHVVTNGSGGDLQAVIDAAADGDTVLVHGGRYDPIALVGRSLTVVAEPELGASVGGLDVLAVGAGQTCVVSGFLVPATTPGPAVEIADCAGAVRLQAVQATAQPSGDGARVASCADVAISRSLLRGGDQTPTPGPNAEIFPVGRGLSVVASSVAVYETSCLGGRGQDSHFINAVFTQVPAGTGGAGVDVSASSTFFAAISTLTGGEGGDGRALACVHLPCGLAPTAGGDGGASLVVEPGSTAAWIDGVLSVSSGGIGGSGGQCCPQTTWPPASNGAVGAQSVGPATALSGDVARLIAPSTAREATLLALTTVGTPGDQAILLTSYVPRWQLDLGLGGVFLCGLPVRRLPLGTIGPAGSLSSSLALPALPAAIEAELRHLQIFVRTGAGPLRPGTPSWTTVLDAAF